MDIVTVIIFSIIMIMLLVVIVGEECNKKQIEQYNTLKTRYEKLQKSYEDLVTVFENVESREL